jgi:hypothetical protein
MMHFSSKFVKHAFVSRKDDCVYLQSDLLTGERKIGDGFVDAYELIKHLVSFVSPGIICGNHAFVSK